MKLIGLRGRKLVDRVRRKGAKWNGRHMKAHYLKSNQHSAFSSQLFVGTSASTKLDKSAVRRNKMRRRCREALRVSLKAESCELKAPIQLLISPRSSSLTCDFAELKADAEALLHHLSRQ